MGGIHVDEEENIGELDVIVGVEDPACFAGGVGVFCLHLGMENKGPESLFVKWGLDDVACWDNDVSEGT